MKKINFGVLIFLFVSAVFSLQAGALTDKKPDITVAKDGSGDVKTVGEAIARVPENNTKRLTIFIKKGVYEEQIKIPADKPFVSLIGESAENTKLTFNITNKIAGTTSAAYAFYVGGHDFYAENLTFENSYKYQPGAQGQQAVAVVAEADRLIFKNCKFLGWQDTLYAKNGRQYYDNCYVEGATDFIFGEAAAVYENCEIHSLNDGYIAAPMRFAADEASGFVFDNCKLTGEKTGKGVFLARPWRDYGRTVYLNTKMDAHIRAEGWNNWQPEREKTAYFAEYNSTGAGAKTSERVKWSHQLTETEAKQFAPENFLKGADRWNLKISDGKSGDDKKLSKPIEWKEVLKQPKDWYATDEAPRIADQVVLYQKENGGWEKNIDMAAMLTEAERKTVVREKHEGETIDNDATYTQIRFLAKVITASLTKPTPPNNFENYKTSFNRGLDYLFAAQYANGGYPQFYPLRKGYYTHITFNDDAMIGVLKLLRDVSKKDEDFQFVDEARRVKAENAVAKAEPLILKLQVEIGGKKTVWAAQYDEETLKPAAARKFEPISLTAGESVGIVKYLMLDTHPSAEKIQAIEAAIDWYRKNKIEGIRWVRVNGENSIVKDAKAPPIWARFYEIETMKPIFSGRDSVIRYDVSQIETERRNGYAWYVESPENLLEKDYPKWKQKIAENKK